MSFALRNVVVVFIVISSVVLSIETVDNTNSGDDTAEELIDTADSNDNSPTSFTTDIENPEHIAFVDSKVYRGVTSPDCINIKASSRGNYDSGPPSYRIMVMSSKSGKPRPAPIEFKTVGSEGLGLVFVTGVGSDPSLYKQYIYETGKSAFLCDLAASVMNTWVTFGWNIAVTCLGDCASGKTDSLVIAMTRAGFVRFKSVISGASYAATRLRTDNDDFAISEVGGDEFVEISFATLLGCISSSSVRPGEQGRLDIHKQGCVHMEGRSRGPSNDPFWSLQIDGDQRQPLVWSRVLDGDTRPGMSFLVGSGSDATKYILYTFDIYSSAKSADRAATHILTWITQKKNFAVVCSLDCTRCQTQYLIDAMTYAGMKEYKNLKLMQSFVATRIRDPLKNIFVVNAIIGNPEASFSSKTHCGYK